MMFNKYLQKVAFAFHFNPMNPYDIDVTAIEMLRRETASRRDARNVVNFPPATETAADNREAA